jgi:hypothetical protein
LSKGHDRAKDDPDHPAHQPHRPHSKKDTRRWCRGKVGVPHSTVLQLAAYAVAFKRTCQATKDGTWWAQRAPWACHHQRVCETCGKITDHAVGWQYCPDLPDALRASLSSS